MGILALFGSIALNAKKGDVIKDTLDANYGWVINYTVLTENSSTKKGTAKYELFLQKNAGLSGIKTDSLVSPDKLIYNGITYTITQIGGVHLLNTIKYISFPTTITKILFSNFNSNYNSNPKIEEFEIMDLNKYFKISTDQRMYVMNNQDFYSMRYGSESTLLWSFKQKYDNGTFVPTQMKINGDTLTELTVPDNITKVNDALFWGCGSLKKLTVPEGVTTIGIRSFGNCANLEEITLPSTLTTIDEYAFVQCINLKKINWSGKPSNLSIGQGAFQGCISLTEDPLFEGVTKLGHSAFMECIGLKKVNLPLSLTQVGGGCFRACQFDQLVFPESLTNLKGVSSDLPNVRVFKIPNSVKTITYAFRNCTKLSHLTLPTYIESFDLNSLGLNILNHSYRNSYTYNGEIPYMGHPNFSNLSNSDWLEVRGPITEVTFPKGIKLNVESTDYNANNYNPKPNLHSVFVMGDTITEEMMGDNLTIYVKKSVYDEKYTNGTLKAYMRFNQGGIGGWLFGESDTKENIEVPVSYKIPLSMTNASGSPIEYKTLCRDFDVDLTHTNDDLPEGVEPLRAYLVEDVDGDLRMVFLNEIKYIPSRLKANVTDEDGNLYQGVDEYVGVILHGTPGYTYYYEMGEHDYTQGAEGQWLMDDAMEYSNANFEQNLMSGDANDDFYVYKTVEDDDNNEIVNYGLNAGKFKIYNKDGWLNYNKSYLQLPKDVSAAIEGDTDAEGNANLTFVFQNADGSTDNVSSVEFNRTCESDIFYNPYGQQVSKNTKGIVINNGRKFVNK